MGKNESMVSFVSRRYMRGENGKDSLMVCLSKYQILRSVYILVIKVCFVLRPRTAMVFKIMSYRPMSAM